ncbi:hypothetical protein COCCU_06115 [Corynebacterium occultum]|uniref:Secreted protein n=1 Tax=Corynebacterium occultum TaxID=2675219 RepID=A0A6B8W5D0_9CORY|nr:hypothetical protein COCCU_06115 [Corynebacterium occultum]
MKRLVPLIFTLPLLLTGCSSSTEEDPSAATTYSSTTNAQNETTETSATLSEGGGTIEGIVGREAGYDCEAIGDCSVMFTVESLEQIEQCNGTAWGERPEGTGLVKATILITTKPSPNDYDPTTFPIWTDWSALTKDGLNHDLPMSTWCDTGVPAGADWMNPVRLGDTERRVHLMDVPEGSTAIRLTALDGGRWEYPLPESTGQTQVSIEPQEPDTKSAPNSEVRTPQTRSSAPVPAPVPAPAVAPAPVVGFTGAPSVETPRVLDKQIASCGDPTMHQTGTTFFTDGTSGWTEACSSQMQQ